MFAKGKGGLHNGGSSKRRGHASSTRFRIRPWAVVAWVAAWQIASMLMSSALLLPGPADVLVRFFELAATSEFWMRVAFTLVRIAEGFAFGTLLGLLCAAGAMRFARLGELFAPAMALMKSVPVACFVVLALIWAGASQLAVVVSVLVVAPIMYENVCDGVRSTDVRLLEMAHVLRVPSLRRLSAIYLPQVWPYFRAACASGMGMAWKAGVAAEIIAIPAGSMGEALYGAKIYFDTADLFAWTLAVVCLSVLFEKALSWLLVGVDGAFGATAGASSRRSGSVGLYRGGKGVSGADADPGAASRSDSHSDSNPSPDPSPNPALRQPYCGHGACEPELSVVRFCDVAKSFDGVQAFSGVSFVAEPGTSVCLMAPSGFGKTTLLRMAAGLETPDEGSVSLCRIHREGESGSSYQEGPACNSCAADPRHSSLRGATSGANALPRYGGAGARPRSVRAVPCVSMVFQEDRLIEHLDALANARLALRPHDAAWAEAPSLLEALGVGECIGRPACACSGGQRRRIALARALLAPHGILLLDEPFSGLDSRSRETVAAIVRDREEGRTLIVAAHDPYEAELLSSCVVRLA